MAARVRRSIADLASAPSSLAVAAGVVERVRWTHAVWVRFVAYFWPVGAIIVIGFLGIVARAAHRGRLWFVGPFAAIVLVASVATWVAMMRVRKRPRSGCLLCRVGAPRLVPDDWQLPRIDDHEVRVPAIYRLVLRDEGGIFLEADRLDLDLREFGLVVRIQCTMRGWIARCFLERDGRSVVLDAAGKLSINAAWWRQAPAEGPMDPP
jgi:hypothetical protein